MDDYGDKMTRKEAATPTRASPQTKSVSLCSTQRLHARTDSTSPPPSMSERTMLHRRGSREELGGPRPHDIKALAELGVLQYWWTEHKVRRRGDLVSCQPTLQ